MGIPVVFIFQIITQLLIILEYNNRHLCFCDTHDTLLGVVDITDEVEAITLT